MKRICLLCNVVLLFLLSYANPVTIKPGLTLDYDDGKYIIHFEMPDYEEMTNVITVNQNTSPSLEQLAHASGNYYFSKIQLLEDDYFDYLNEDGRPELPFYSMNLLLPPDCDCGNIDVNIVNYNTETIQLTYDYIPSQINNTTLNDFSYDNNYYGHYDNTWYWIDYLYDTIQYRFTKGISFAIFPCHYEPYSKELTIVTDMTLEILHDGVYINSTYLGQLLNTDRSVYYFFDNYVGHTAPYPQFNDKYLIITADEWADSTALFDFVTHKESLGYNVTVTSLSDIPANDSPESIRNYIKTQYETNHIKYVLLIGSVGDSIENSFKLPFFDGEMNDINDPPSDVYYSCLTKNNASHQWMDLCPSVFIGRWPLSERGQLRRVVDKTIASDLYLGTYNPNEIDIFAGSGAHEDYNYNTCEYINNNIIQNNNYYSGFLYDGRGEEYIPSWLSMVDLLADDDTPPLMFIYIGHSTPTSIGMPYSFRSDHINSSLTSRLDYQSFGFGFSCDLGNIYWLNNFARSWVTSTEGGVTFLGASTESTATSDRYLSRALFNQLKDKPNMTIGEFIGNGKAKYYNSLKVIKRLRQAKRYILYGDPSLYLFGTEFQYNNPYSLKKHSSHTLGNDILENNTLVQIYSITGQLLRTSNTNLPYLYGLPDGTYMLIFKSDNNLLTQKIILL